MADSRFVAVEDATVLGSDRRLDRDPAGRDSVRVLDGERLPGDLVAGITRDRDPARDVAQAERVPRRLHGREMPFDPDAIPPADRDVTGTVADRYDDAVHRRLHDVDAVGS